MPDTTTDLIALKAQVKALRGDLDRRFEQFSERFEQVSDRIDQLGGRIDTLSVKEKFSFPFSAALDGDWLGGTTSPAVQLLTPNSGVGGAVHTTIARGTMPVVLPNRSRLQVFRASARVSDVQLGPFFFDQITPNEFFCRLMISLDRIALDTNNSEPVVQLASQFLPGSRDLQADPNPGREFVDNDRFKYFVDAEFTINSDFLVPVLVPPGMVVLNSFHVDCIGA
jgi:hypothetical protein